MHDDKPFEDLYLALIDPKEQEFHSMWPSNQILNQIVHWAKIICVVVWISIQTSDEKQAIMFTSNPSSRIRFLAR